jgi:hypothetical protein
MKPALLLLASSLAIAASGALAQGNADACHNQYGSCMERCTSRPASLQEKCSQSCETSTNQCYATMYGQSSAAQTVQSPPAQAAAQESEAREGQDEAKPEAKPAKGKKKKH